MFQKMISEFGTIDILINNAGIQKDAAFDEMSLDQWNLVFLVINITLRNNSYTERTKDDGIIFFN